MTSSKSLKRETQQGPQMGTIESPKDLAKNTTIDIANSISINKIIKVNSVAETQPISFPIDQRENGQNPQKSIVDISA